MPKTVFLDTSFQIALAAKRDQNHVRAVQLADQAVSEDWLLVTTRAVLFEIGNALSKLRYRTKAVDILRAIVLDPRYQIVEITQPLFDAAFALYEKRMDKEWGLIDCASFVVMTELGVTEALTADEHFKQAGFHALLRTGN